MMRPCEACGASVCECGIEAADFGGDEYPTTDAVSPFPLDDRNEEGDYD
jgi:hypothetical protein